MKRMKHIAFILVIMLLFLNVFSQDNTKAVSLTLLPAKVRGDSMDVMIRVKNTAGSTVSFLKPNLGFVNFHIVNIMIYDVKEQNSIVYYAGNNSQLDQIITKMKSCDILKSGDEKEYLFTLDRKLFKSKISNKWVKKISVEINYLKGEIICNDCEYPLYYGNLAAENVIVYE